MSLKTKAAELRKIALDLEAKADDAPRNAEAVLRRYAPQAANIDIALPLFPLGQRDFDARRFMVNQAGRQLGQHIADMLNFEFESRPDRTAWLRDPVRCGYDEERFRASVYTFTPHQLKDILQKAFDAGRNSQ